MNMKLLEFVTPQPYIYHGFSTRKTFWEDNFTPVNMKSCGRCNVRKHRDSNKGQKYIILYIYSNIYCMKKREVTSSESRDYTERPGKGLTTYLYLRNKRPNKKDKIFHY